MHALPCPSHAVILAAGLGSRLRPLTNRIPKPLVAVHGVPILHNALTQLGESGVRSATIVVGYRQDAIRRACGTRFAGVDIHYVESPVYDRTGSAYSLWLARDALTSGDCLLLEGDVFFEADALTRLVEAGHPDVAAVAPFDETMEGSAVTLSATGHVDRLRMRQTAADLETSPSRLFKTMNLFRFSAETLRRILVPALDELIGAGMVSAYTEQLLAALVEERGLKLAAARCDAVRWFEIDSAADLEIAERIFADLAEIRPIRAATAP
ncbi:MAG: phosphocholine cytidylyltransferase family protein [Alphaproteobacteria bacterium]|nr:phosphocholine cytidylyltransferase family protein [Alphaproteobacteria bacterium]